MGFSLTQFESSAGPLALASIDGNTAALSAAAPVSCTIAGTNTLALTPNSTGLVPSVALSGYTQNMVFSGIAQSGNTGAATAAVGALPALDVYKDTPSGPVALTGGEIIALCAISFRYDSALNSGAGGFHLVSGTAGSSNAIAPQSVQINGGSTLTNLLSGTVALTFTATPGLSSQDQTFTLTGLPPAVPAPGDFVAVNPPSLPNAGVAFWGMCTALGSLSSVASVATINVRLMNLASASLASNSGIYRWKAERTVP
jgi:hypothetical protein